MNPREKLEFPDNSFDLIIDKNDIDANMRSGKKPFLNTAKVLSECQRVMRPGGFLAVVSYADPKNREFLFQGLHLALKVQRFRTKHPMEEMVNNIYIC